MARTLDISDDGIGQLDGVQSAIARATQHMLFARGEWFIDRSIGIPYFTEMLGNRSTPLEIIADALAIEVSRVAGITSAVVRSARLDDSTGVLSVKMDVTTTDGETAILTGVVGG